MKFHLAPPNPFYDKYGVTNRLESENGRWTIYYCPVIYGTRIIVSLTNSPYASVNVCGGNNKINLIFVFATVKCWMKKYPEDTPVRIIEANFPQFMLKPVTQNPEWDEFVEEVFTEKPLTAG